MSHTGIIRPQRLSEVALIPSFIPDGKRLQLVNPNLKTRSRSSVSDPLARILLLFVRRVQLPWASFPGALTSDY